MTLAEELGRRIPHRPYLVDWFSHRERLNPWPGDPQVWVGRAAQAVETWCQQRTTTTPLDRQEQRLFRDLDNGRADISAVLRFVLDQYPNQSRTWDRMFVSDKDHQRSLSKDWQSWAAERRAREQDQLDAAELPQFHAELWRKIQSLADAEAAVHGYLTDRDIGWDLDQGAWDNLNFRPLIDLSELLAREPALERIAELLGRDYRAKTRPPVPPPLVPPTPDADPEPGKTEIQGVRFGQRQDPWMSTEAALLAFPETQIGFFKKDAERGLLVWDATSPAPPRVRDSRRSLERQSQNDRGPAVVILDTSGSMRGKPEEVAKAVVLALLRVCLEENRGCYLINFSSQFRCLDLSQLGQNLPELLHFLEFSFHGGTDLPPALREALRILDSEGFREADVLVVSDFAVPKIPGSVRQAIRRQQETRGTRFYSLTVSVRPLNDFLNIFDAGWVYNIHPYQTNGIAPESLEAL